jgi:hypothetical protein
MDAPASEPRLASARHDVVLVLAMGALAAARRFERAVSTPRSSGQDLSADDPVVLASLGAIALGRTLERWLAAAAAPCGEATPTRRRDAPISLRELWR